MKNKSLSCIILDDEPLAVRLLEEYASKIPFLEVLYSGTNAFEAMKVLNHNEVDLVFIDIQMPELTGIEFMELFDKKNNFIITSAYPHYALDSFRFRVIDFVLKPITFNRFYQSINKFLSWKETFHSTDEEDFLIVKADRKHYKIDLKSIIYIESLKDYIRIHTGKEKIMMLENMKDIVQKLPSSQFLRIHRSYIIAKSQVKLVEGNRIQLLNQEYIPIGETYKEKVLNWLK